VYVQGTVNGTGNYVGGLVGALENGNNTGGGFIDECAADVTVGSDLFGAGGLAGVFDAVSITNSYALGDVQAGSKSAGGLVAYNDATLSSCYAAGTVTAPTAAGGLAAESYVAVSSANHWDSEASGQASSPNGGTPNTTAQMMQQATFSGWDFTNTWDIHEGSSYPFLRWETRPVLRGTVSITGAATYGLTLSANVSLLTYTSAAPADVLRYQWKRAGTPIVDANGSTYTPMADDVGKAITVTVSADGSNAQGSVTSADTAVVEKADGPTAPDAPTAASITHNSVTLAAHSGNEYSRDGGTTWQDSAQFAGLAPETGYSFTERVKETATHKASATSGAATITTTAMPVMGGAVTIGGSAKFGEVLTVDTAGVTYAPATTTPDVPTCQYV
jgi:hypothetical protein